MSRVQVGLSFQHMQLAVCHAFQNLPHPLYNPPCFPSTDLHSKLPCVCRVQMGLSSQHMQLASYLPQELVEAYQGMGMVHDLYQWQVRRIAAPHQVQTRLRLRSPSSPQLPVHVFTAATLFAGGFTRDPFLFK